MTLAERIARKPFDWNIFSSRYGLQKNRKLRAFASLGEFPHPKLNPIPELIGCSSAFRLDHVSGKPLMSTKPLESSYLISSHLPACDWLETNSFSISMMSDKHLNIFQNFSFSWWNQLISYNAYLSFLNEAQVVMFHRLCSDHGHRQKTLYHSFWHSRH